MNELAAQIEADAARLTKRMDEVFELGRNAQISNKEIAGQLNVSDKTLQKQMNIGTKKLYLKISTLLFSLLKNNQISR